MDRWKFFAVTHRDHLYCNPVDAAVMDEVLDLLRLPDGAQAVDIACGKGEFALRVAERYRVQMTGVDLSPECVAEAAARALTRSLRGSASFVLGDGAAYAVAPGSLAFAACVGASWVFSGYSRTLAALAAMVRAGGLVLVGEPFWRCEPSERYLEATAQTRDGYGSHIHNVSAGVSLGLAPLYAAVSGIEAWDRYEGLQWQAAERYAAEWPDDPDGREIVAAVRRRRDAYLDGGRDALGWALYLFRKG